MMSDNRRRRSPESSRRRRKSRRDSREWEKEQEYANESAASNAMASYPQGETVFSASTTGGPASSYYPSQQTQFTPSSAAFPAQGSPIVMRSSEQPTPRAPSGVPIPIDLNRPQRVRRQGSRSSLGSSSASSSSSSSYLDISRWYPSWGRGGGVLKTFFKTPSEHRPQRRRSQRKMHKKSSKKTKGVFVLGSNNSSSSSVNSDMAYGMGFIKKPKSRGGEFSPNMTAAAASVSGRERERSEGRPGMQRRQTDEEIREIGRKLQDVARMQNRADLDRRGKSSWESYQRQSSSGVEVSSRGLASSVHGRRHHHVASSSDDEWESASEGEDSDGMSALAYGQSPIPTPRPARSSTSRMSTASAIAAGSALVAGSAIATSTVADKKSTVVDPKLFGPTNSLRDFINTPCGFNDDDGAYNYPRPRSGEYKGSAETASVEARPLQRVFPLQTSDPGQVEAARASGSVISSQQNYTSIVRNQSYSNTSVTNRPEPVPIQAPKPIAPVPSRIYHDEPVRDAAPEAVERRRKPTSDNKIYAETALVGAGVAALGAAILAGRDKGKGKEDDSEITHGKHEKYGHDDHRQENTKVEDARKAQELRLMQEIERLEKALGKTNKAREQRRRDSKRERDSGSFIDASAEERRKTDEERYHEHEPDRKRWGRESKRGEPSDYDSRVSVPSERVALLEDDTQYRLISGPTTPGGSAPIDVFQFQVPDDAFTTGTTPPKAASPIIIDVTPAPSPEPERRRDSRRSSVVEEMRDAHRIYEEAHHSTAPIPEVVMAAAIGAIAHSRHHGDAERDSDRGRTNDRAADMIQEEANKFYAARRVAEREIRSRSRSKSREDPMPRIVTPPEMQNRPPKNPFSGANADFRFDKEMMPAQLDDYRPEVAPVRDPSAERPRPVLNLVMPSPASTPEPDRQRKGSVVKKTEPEPVEEPKTMPSVIFGPRGEVIEVEEAPEEPPTQTFSKRVSWGPSETKQYEEHSPERSRDNSPEKPKKGFGGWGAIAAAVTGAGVGAAIASDQEPKSPRREERSWSERSSGSRSPPKERPVLSKDMSSHVLTEEPEEPPPAPGPKPASPRNSQQMPGAFGDDIDFAATLAAGLEQSGFDPEIVIDNPEYHRRDSPPGSNAPYSQPFAETVSDLGMYSVDDGYSSVSRGSGYVIGEVDTPGTEKAAPLEDYEDVSHDKTKKDKRSSSVYDDIEVIEDPEEAEPDTSKLSKKERRKLEKAAQAAKLAEEERQAAESRAVEAGDDEWADPPTSKKSKKSKKAKRSSVAWDDADTPVNDTHVSVPIDAFDDVKETGPGDHVDDWDTPKKGKKSKRSSQGYDVSGDDPNDREKRDHRRTEFYEPIDRDVASVVSDSRFDEPSNGHDDGDDDRSVASAPSGTKRDSKRDSKRSSGGFWSLLGGQDQQQSKKDNADTLGAGVGLAGVAAAAVAAVVASSDAAGASPGQKQEEAHVEKDVPREEGFVAFEDPEIAPRFIKPAIDPQYGDLLPLPPSPGESSLDFEEEDTLPALPDSRPTTPPGQAPSVVRGRENSMKRPTFATHARRTSTSETPLRSPSHTAIPIQFRMGHRSVSATSPAIGSRSSPALQSPPTPAQESPPMFRRGEFSPTFKRQPSRPTSWDNSREIKPLYLLERSARPGSDEEQRNEVAEMIPLPPSRQSPVPEDQLEYQQPIGLGVDASPLVIDTDVARSSGYGSQEPTPTGIRPSEPSPSLAQEAEMTPLGFPSSSSVPESSYATPGEFPRDVNTTSSPQLEPAVDEAAKEIEKPKQSYFPSALSMLPAATLAGVGVLLGRAHKNETSAHSDDQDSKSKFDGSLPKSAEPLSEAARDLPLETTRIEQTALAEPEPETMTKADAIEELAESPNSKMVELQSPADFQDAQAEFPIIPSSEEQPEAIQQVPEAAIETTGLSALTGPKMKKKKNKKKHSVSEVSQSAIIADQDTHSESMPQQELSAQKGTDLEPVYEPSILVEPGSASDSAQLPGNDSADTIVEHTSAPKQVTPALSEVIVDTIGPQAEKMPELETSQIEMRETTDLSSSAGLHGAVISQPEVGSEAVLEQSPGKNESASIAPDIEEPSYSQSETIVHVHEDPVSVETEEMRSTDVLADSKTEETEPVEDDWATASSKKRSKKKKRQSVALTEDIADSPATPSSDNKSIDDVEEPPMPQDLPSSTDVIDSTREGTQEPSGAPVQPLDAETVLEEAPQQSLHGISDMTEEPAMMEAIDTQVDEPSRGMPLQEDSIIPIEQADEPKVDVPHIPTDEVVALPAEQQESQQEIDPVPVSAEDEYPIISKKSKKNKKRKGSKAIYEPVHTPVTATSIDSLQVELPADLSHQSAIDPEDDVLHSESEQHNIASDDAVPFEGDAHLTLPPADEASQSTEATEDQPLSAQEDLQPTTMPLESQAKPPASPILTPHESPSQLEATAIETEPLNTSTEPFIDLKAIQTVEPEVMVGDTAQSTETALDSAALPAQEDPSTKSPSPNVEHDSLKPQVLQEPVYEVEVTGQEEHVPTTEQEQSESGPARDLQKSLDEAEAAHRETEAIKVQDEEAELARLQLKRKPSKKDKSRLKDLKARAQQRAEEAEAIASSSHATKSLVVPTLEPEVIQGSDIAEDKPTEAVPVEEPVLPEEIVQIASTSDSKDSDPSREISRVPGQDNEESSPTDENVQAELPSESQHLQEDTEEIARRSAEAEKIRDEESELARLKLKRKPSKKDKTRIRALQANAEEREREAETAAQKQTEVEAEITPSIEEVSQSLDLFSGPAEEVLQSTIASEVLEDGGQAQVEIIAEPAQEDTIARDIDSTGQSHTEIPKLGQSDDQIAQDIAEPSIALDKSGGTTEQHVGDDREGTTPEQLASVPGHEIDTSSCALEKDLMAPESPLDEVVKDITRQAPSSHDKPKSTFGGWGVIAAAVAGAGVDTALGENDQPQQVAGGHGASDAPESLESLAKNTQDEPPRPELQEDTRPSSEVKDTASPEQVLPTEVADPVPPKSEEVVSNTEGIPLSRVTTERLVDVAPLQAAAAEIEPDSEWSMPTKKSKKDKKKKRKGTMSGDSVKSSGLATPFESSEPSEHETASEAAKEEIIGAPTTHDDIVPTTDPETVSVHPAEAARVEELDPAYIALPRNEFTEDIAPSAHRETVSDTQADQNQQVNNRYQSHSPVDVAQPVTTEESKLGLGESVPLEDLMDLPASLARAVETTPQSQEPMHVVTEPEPSLDNQEPSQDIKQHDGEFQQPIAPTNESAPAVEATSHTASQNQDITSATETTRDMPPEVAPDTSIKDESEQLETEESTWAPVKKKDKKKKKKRGSVAWSEPASDAQTPASEDAPLSSAQDISQEMSMPTEPLKQAESLSEPREWQPQLDERPPTVPGEDEKNTDVTSWEPERTTQALTGDEPRESQDVADVFTDHSAGMDTVNQPFERVQSDDVLQGDSGSIHGPDLTADRDGEDRPLAGEATAQLPLGSGPQPGAPEGLSSHESAPESAMESKIEEGEDTVVVVGGKVPDTDLLLTGEEVTSQLPLASSPSPTTLDESSSGDNFQKLPIGNQADQSHDPVIPTDTDTNEREALGDSERKVDSPPFHEPLSGLDLDKTVDGGEDTLIVADGKVADEVSEPWTFEAAHDSPTFTKQELDNKIEDGEDTVIVAGGDAHDDFSGTSYMQTKSDSHDDGQSIQEKRHEFLDVDRSTSRPQSPAPWGDEDYSAAPQHLHMEHDQPVAGSASPESKTPTGQHDGLHAERSAIRPESPAPSDGENDSAFVTPFEEVPVSTAEALSSLDAKSQQVDEQPLEWSPTKSSKKNKKNKKKSSISQSFDSEPGPSTSAPETPHFEQASDQLPFTTPVEAPYVSDPVANEAVESAEPATESFDDWIPKKLTKKEKRKAKKGSVSITDPEASKQSLEETQPEPVPGSSDQLPKLFAILGDEKEDNRSQTGTGHFEEPAQLRESIGEPKFNRDLDVGSVETIRPESPGREVPDESGKAVEPEEVETSGDRQKEPSSSVPEEATVAAATAATAVPLLTRKMSKKEKRKAKKASSSWEDDVLETSQAPSSAGDEFQSQEAAIVASPIEESPLAQGDALDIAPAKPQPDQDVFAESGTSTAREAVAEDEWAMPLSRKKSKGKKKKGKQLSLDWSTGEQAPTTEDTTDSASAEGQELEKSAHVTLDETVAQNEDDVVVPTSPPRPDPVEISEAPSSAHLEAKSPATLGTDLQKIPSAAPSPDPWENEDYFKPKTADSSPIDPPEEPFGKVEVHPAFKRGLNTASDNRDRDERPLVGLGLIHRHSSIFQEDDGHTPKLLTLTSDNASIESLAIEETSLPAQESTVTSSSTHPPRRFPLSPRLSPRPAPEEPPKSPIPEEIKLSQRGSVAMLAQRFGGKRKKVSKYVDKRAPVEDDLFDDAAMWEGAERKAVDGSRMDDDAGDFWAVEDQSLYETSEPDTQPGQGTASTAHSMGTKHGDDNVSATYSPPGPDAGRFTPELPGKATREEEIPLEPLVESPVLGSQASNGFPSPDPQHTASAPHSPSSPETRQTTRRPANIADTWDLIGARPQRQHSPDVRSGSPDSEKPVDLKESALPSNETEHGESLDNFIPTVDFRRSVSRGLPPVQEEPSEEDAEFAKHKTSLTVATPDINRDSGFVTDSPHQVWTRRFNDNQQRDSGVHLHDNRDRSPGLHSSRGVSPDPSRVSRSSVEDEGARLDEKARRSPLTKYERRLREDTPVLEAQEPPITPEPQKTRSDGSRTHKYPDLRPGATTATALAGGAALLAAQKSGPLPPSAPRAEDQRSVSDSFAAKLHESTQSKPETVPRQRRAVSNTRITRAKTPEPLNLQPDSPSLLRHSGTPPLRSRRTRSGDLRTLSQSSNRSQSDLGSGVGASPSPVGGGAPTPAAAANTPVPASSSSSSDLRKAPTPAAPQTSTSNPVANEGRLRSKDMADVYDGFGEGRLGSPRSPTRPHSMRRRQSMQVLDLENRVEQLMAENRALAEAKTQAELLSSNRVTSSLADRDNEIEALKQSLDFMRKEIHRLTEVNEGLNSAISQSAIQHQDRYRQLETQHAATTGELDSFRNQYGSHQQTLEEKDAEIRSLREQLDAIKDQVRELQKQILATNPADSDFLRIKDVDYFDHRCQQLCSHVQQWVLRFSKFSDMRACRLTTELNDEKIIDRLDNAVLDGSNVDSYLNDRVRRRDVFMSLAMTMIWEFVFTRYLFGMDREQRQKLKALEKLLLEVGPPKAVRQWRAVTLTLLSRRDAFKDQREQDTEAVVQAVFQTLSMILPPPSNLEEQIQNQLRKVMREAVDLSIEMRTQRAEYMMLPPLQPEYDASGDLAEPHPFNAQLMSERSGDKSNDDDLQAEGAIVRLVLFPLVVKKGDDEGVGDDEVVVCPAQVIVKKPRSSSRRSMRATSSDAGGVSLLRGASPSTAPNRSNVSMAEAEYIEGGI